MIFVSFTVLFFFASVSLTAHPHVFIQGSIDYISSGHSIRGIRLSWRFDDMSSASMITGYPHSATGFSADTAKRIKADEFDYLRNYQYFVRLVVDGKALKKINVEDFQPTLARGTLIYSFTIPIALGASPAGHEIKIIVFDDTFFVAFDKMTIHLVSWLGIPVPDAKIQFLQKIIDTDGWGKQPADEIVVSFGG